MREKENKTKTVIKAGIWYTASSFLTKGIAFISTPIFTRLLSSNDFGEYNNFTAWAGIIVIVATMDMHTTVNRARYDYENLDGYLSSVALSGTIVTTIIWGIVQLFPTFFCKLFSMEMPYINLLFITTMVSPALTLLQAKNRIHYKYKTYVALSLGSVFLSTAVSVTLVLLMKDKLTGRIIGHYGTVFVIDLLVYIYIIYKGRQFKWSEFKYALLICIPMIPHLLSKYVLNQSDRIMIKQFCGASDTAYYSLAYTCAMIPIMLAQATNIAWSPWSSEQIHLGRYENIRKASYYYILLFYAIVFGVFLLGPEIVFVLGGKKYTQAIYVLPPVVMGAAFQFLYNLYVALEQFAKKTVGMALATVAAAIINIVLNWLLIPRYGYIAAAYTTLVGYACLLISHFFLAKRTGYAEAYDEKFIFISLAALFCVMLVVLRLYSLPSVIRYLIATAFVVFLCGFVYKKRDILARINKGKDSSVSDG
ncbi:MAG: flippase [Oscillospiraceae bacterium]|nr:flippase [Oscillospiraceae bacterium]